MWNRHSGAIQCFLEDDFLNSESVLTTQSHPTLCDPIGCSPAGSSAHGILQVRILVWVVVVQSLSRARLFCEPMDYSSLGYPVRGISQVIILEYFAISFSRGSS